MRSTFTGVRYNTYGSDAAVIMLDSRSFRDAQIEPVNLGDPSDATRFLNEAFDPSRTLLGREQVEDLKADLRDAEANGITWKFITIPEPIQNFGLLNAEDRFEGYAAERNEILQYIDQNFIKNLLQEQALSLGYDPVGLNNNLDIAAGAQ
ncbi:MAG: alkaline phosphatase D family protein [Xenococcaceae cyanobacterium MO_234.B1]|nr:alkaline phosphatase D family protein [Xenococcaceae cyanobacterium MO_234.B1]